MQRKKVLVVDDRKVNRDIAMAQLGLTHDLTVVSAYDEAQKLIQMPHDFEIVLADLLMPTAETGQEMANGIFLALLALKNGAKGAAVFTDSNDHDHPALDCFGAFNRKGGESRPQPLAVGQGNLLFANSRNWVNWFTKENLLVALDPDWYYRECYNRSQEVNEEMALERGQKGGELDEKAWNAVCQRVIERHYIHGKNWAMLFYYLINEGWLEKNCWEAPPFRAASRA